LINKGNHYSKSILDRYKEENAFVVKDDLGNPSAIKVIRRKLNSRKVFFKPTSDKLKRSLIRHDPTKLAKAVVSLL
jgi:hypothetical protein